MSIIRILPSFRLLRLVLQSGVGSILVVFLAWLLIVLDWPLFFAFFAEIHFGYWLGGIGMKGLVLVVRGIRVHGLFRAETSLRLEESVRYTILGQFGNVVFPAKMGEGLKVVLFKKKTNRSWLEVLFLLLTERLLDLWCLLWGLALVFQFAPFAETFRPLGWLFSLGAIVLSLIFFCSTRIPCPKKFQLFFRQAMEARSLLPISLLIWMGESMGLWFFLKAFELGTLYQAFSITFFYHLAIAVPSTPGNLGIFELIYVYALGLFLVSPELALALSLIVQFSLFALYIGMGAIVIFYEGMTWSSLKEIGKQGQEQFIA